MHVTENKNIQLSMYMVNITIMIANLTAMFLTNIKRFYLFGGGGGVMSLSTLYRSYQKREVLWAEVKYCKLLTTGRQLPIFPHKVCHKV